MITKNIDGKLVIIKSSLKNIPPLSTVKKIYSKIPDDKHIPIVFETKTQYLNEYIKNQEKDRGKPFPKLEVQEYKSSEMERMGNIVSRYTTKHNPYIDVRTVFFTDHKITPTQFKKSALHEFGHELWENNPKLRMKWKNIHTKAPTPYGKTSIQEDVAESYMLYKTGGLQDARRKSILVRDGSYNRNRKDIASPEVTRGLQGPASYGFTYSANNIDPLKQFDVNHDGIVDDKDIRIMLKQGKITKTGRIVGNTASSKIMSRITNNPVLSPFSKAFQDIRRVTRPASIVHVDIYGRDSVGDVLGWNIPEDVLGTASWKLYGAPKKYDPRQKERADLRGNILDILGTHNSKLWNMQEVPTSPIIDMSPNFIPITPVGKDWGELGTATKEAVQELGIPEKLDTAVQAVNKVVPEPPTTQTLGEAVSTIGQRLSKENLERTYYGMDRPHTAGDQQIRLGSAAKAGLIWTGATAIKGAEALGEAIGLDEYRSGILSMAPSFNPMSKLAELGPAYTKGRESKAAELASYQSRGLLPSQVRASIASNPSTQANMLGPSKLSFGQGLRELAGIPEETTTTTKDTTPYTTQVGPSIYSYGYIPPPGYILQKKEKPKATPLSFNKNILRPVQRIEGGIYEKKPWILQ